MFTGLIQHIGRASRVSPSQAGVRLSLDPRGWMHQPQVGDSIAVDGVCLTVAGVEGALEFDVIPQTLSLTTLGALAVGDRVHLEHAVLASSPLGGHLVQGHVDEVGRVLAVDRARGWRVRIAPSGTVADTMLAQGSITVDGVSLTIAEADADRAWFEVALIPETLARTTLGELAEGDAVNLEADHLAKLIAREVARHMERAPR